MAPSQDALFAPFSHQISEPCPWTQTPHLGSSSLSARQGWLWALYLHVPRAQHTVGLYISVVSALMTGLTHLFSAYLHRATFWTGHISLCPLSFSAERAHCVPFLPCRILGTEPGTPCHCPGAPSMAAARALQGFTTVGLCTCFLGLL